MNSMTDQKPTLVTGTSATTGDRAATLQLTTADGVWRTPIVLDVDHFAGHSPDDALVELAESLNPRLEALVAAAVAGLHPDAGPARWLASWGVRVTEAVA